MRRTLALAAVTVASLALSGPTSRRVGPRAPRPTWILLVNRQFEPAEGVERAIAARAAARATDRLHFILQFRAGSSGPQRVALASAANIRLLGGVPENAYVASAPSEFFVSATQSAIVRWVGSLQSTDKLAPAVLARTTRATVSAGGRGGRGGGSSAVRDTSRIVPLIVRFFGDVSIGAQDTTLRKYGIADGKRIEYLNGWSIIADRDAILPLAGDDGVQWLEEVPEAPRPDNDGIRAAGGVNADSISTGTPYGLSGAGVTIGSWDNAPPSPHLDFASRLTIVGNVPLWGRYQAHEETGPTTNRYDIGENVYIDMDDDGCVSVGDIHSSPAAGRLTGDVVQAGDPDVTTPCRALVSFWLGGSGLAPEKYFDMNSDHEWEFGEPIYVDNDDDGLVSAGDKLETVATAAPGAQLTEFNNTHWHPTMMAGTAAGSGAHSLNTVPISIVPMPAPGTALQWQGVAPGANLRAYTLCQTIECLTSAWTASSSTTYVGWLSGQYQNAGGAGAEIALHAWGSKNSHYHELSPLAERYSALSAIYDEVVSGFTSAGTASALPRLFIAASAGNAGTPERHTESTPNGLFDAGEIVVVDADGDGKESVGDAVWGSIEMGAKLIDFRVDEMHTIDPLAPVGSYAAGEGIYRDNDHSGTVTVGDTRIQVSGFSTGTIVSAGSADLATPLQTFGGWGTLRSANAAKNTLQLGMIATDAIVIPAEGSRGPTADGRTKPDLVAAGAQVGGDLGVTTTHTRNRYYTLESGTSFSTAAAAGSGALLAEWYHSACSATLPTADVLKALLIHGAEDIVLASAHAGVGPDFATGYGRLRVKQAADLLPSHVLGTIVSAPVTFKFTIGRMQPLRVTLVWNDPPSTPGTLPGAHGLLQHDLDLTLVAPDGTQYTPWELDPLQPDAPAHREQFPFGTVIPETARDRVNTVEQVVVDDAMAGAWSVVVSAANALTTSQPFVLVSEAFAPPASPCATSPAADVWVRDNDTDDGTVPSGGLLWLSPDIWNRLLPDGQPGHENPIFEHPNYLYVNIRNRTAEPVKATTIVVWIAEASTGLHWPTDFLHAARFVVPNLAPNEVRQVGPISWTPPAPIHTTHYCLYYRVASSQDPITIVEGTDIGANVSLSNNIAQRNLNIIDLSAPQPQPAQFLIQAVDTLRQAIRLEFRVPTAFYAAGGEVRVALSQPLARQLDSLGGRALIRGLVSLRDSARRDPPSLPRERARPAPYRVTSAEASLGGFVLKQGEAQPVAITFRASDQRAAAHNIDVIQWSGNRMVGGIRYVVRTGPRH